MFGTIFTGSVLSGTSLGLAGCGGGLGTCPDGSHDVGTIFEDCVPDLQSGAAVNLTEAPTYKPPTSTPSGGGSVPKPAPKPVAVTTPPPSSGFSLSSVTGNPLVLGGILLVLGGGAIYYAKHRKAARALARPLASGLPMGDPVYLFIYSDLRPGWVGQGWFAGSFNIIPAVGLRWVSGVEKAKSWLGAKVVIHDRGWWAMQDPAGVVQYGRYGEMTSDNAYGTTLLVGGQLYPYKPQTTYALGAAGRLKMEYKYIIRGRSVTVTDEGLVLGNYKLTKSPCVIRGTGSRVWVFCANHRSTWSKSHAVYVEDESQVTASGDARAIVYSSGVTAGPAGSGVVVEEVPDLGCVIVSLRADKADGGEWHGWSGWTHGARRVVAEAIGLAETMAAKHHTTVRLVRHPERPR